MEDRYHCCQAGGGEAVGVEFREDGFAQGGRAVDGTRKERYGGEFTHLFRFRLLPELTRMFFVFQSSLVELELGQVRKWHNDDALLKQLRLRELNTINPPTTSSSSTSSSQTPALFPHALLGVIKTTRPSSSHLSTFNNAPSSSSASSSDLDLDLPSRYPPPRFNFTPPPPDQSALRKDWKDGYPPAPKSFKEFKDGTWDDGYGGRLREEIWDFLKATNSDAGGQKAQDYKTKFDAIGYLDTFFRWHEEVSFVSSFPFLFSSVGTGEGKEGGR